MAYINDNAKLREAVLGNSAADKDTSRDMRVKIILNTIVAPISHNQFFSGTGEELEDPETISYVSNRGQIFIGKPTNEEIINVLVDPLDEDRYVPISVISGITYAANFVLYYDKKYKDLFYIPNTRTFGDTELTKDFLKSTNVTIEGVVVGVSTNVYTPHASGPIRTLVDIYDGKCISWPEPTGDLSSCKMSLMPTYNGNITGTIDAVGSMLSPSTYVESTKQATVSMNSIGTNTALFTDKIPIVRAILVGPTQYQYIYVGKQDVADILIPVFV